MASSSKSHITVEIEPDSFREMYPHDLHLYDKPPSGEITLVELQDLSTERLKVLKLVDKVCCLHPQATLLYRKAVLSEELVKHGLVSYTKLINSPGCVSHTKEDLHIRRRDHLSHFILRSAFSFIGDKKKWFYIQETRLFKWRLSSLDNKGICEFNCINDFNYKPISIQERTEIKDHLCIASHASSSIDDVPFYKVPFYDVSCLINRREVFLRGGMAYVPENKLGFVFFTHFKRHLVAGFQNAREVVLRVFDDKRLTHIFKELSDSVIIRSCRLNSDASVSINDLDELSQKSYPLCMRRLHEALRTNHHLTNGGRVQYCLFIKGIGVSLNDALKLWKSEFTKVMDEERFQKEYRYNVLHLFGMVGKCKDYEPHGCSKIMKAHVGPRDYHGCTFKHLSSAILHEKLTSYGLAPTDIRNIINLTNVGQYTSACTKYFEITHNCIQDKQFKHPNEYFTSSKQQFVRDLNSSNLSGLFSED